VTKNRRYETHYDALNDQRIQQSVAQNQPCALPAAAYGTQPIEWAPQAGGVGVDLMAGSAGFEDPCGGCRGGMTGWWWSSGKHPAGGGTSSCGGTQ